MVHGLDFMRKELRQQWQGWTISFRSACVMSENRVKCMNQWDIQSKHVFDISGITETLYAGECRWGGGEHYVCYEREQIKVHESVGSSEQETISD